MRTGPLFCFLGAREETGIMDGTCSYVFGIIVLERRGREEHKKVTGVCQLNSDKLFQGFVGVYRQKRSVSRVLLEGGAGCASIKIDGFGSVADIYRSSALPQGPFAQASINTDSARLMRCSRFHSR